MSAHPLNVLVIHGIGDHAESFTEEFDRDLSIHVRRYLEPLAARYGLAPPPAAPLLNVIPGVWASVAEGILKELEHRLFQGRVDRLRAFAMRFMGDVVAYQGAAAYEEIHRLIAFALRSRVRPDSTHLTIVAHSLGSVIASDFVYDHTRRHGTRFRDHFGVDFVNFFTLGSPLALYAARSPVCAAGEFGPGQVVECFSAPVRVETDWGVWLNIYSDDDVVGYPLKSVNDAYRLAVTADVVTDAGNLLTRWNPLSHGAYWAEEAVVAMIAEKLAIDYAARNLGLAGPQLHDAVRAYRRQLLHAPVYRAPQPSVLPDTLG